MEFEWWLVIFGRDLEILVSVWMDLYHVAGPQHAKSLINIQNEYGSTNCDMC